MLAAGITGDPAQASPNFSIGKGNRLLPGHLAYIGRNFHQGNEEMVLGDRFSARWVARNVALQKANIAAFWNLENHKMDSG
jgi:hypothetical protein